LSVRLIVEVIHRYHPEWEPPVDTGYEWVSTLCPFHHETNRSASVSYSRDAFHCFACPVKGDAIALLREQEGMSFAEAVAIAERLSEGSYKPLSHKPARQPRRRVFGDEGSGPFSDREAGQVPAGFRGRSSPWT
jgi:DNA primase